LGWARQDETSFASPSPPEFELSARVCTSEQGLCEEIMHGFYIQTSHSRTYGEISRCEFTNFAAVGYDFVCVYLNDDCTKVL
jgi:hypothetical protein